MPLEILIKSELPSKQNPTPEKLFLPLSDKLLQSSLMPKTLEKIKKEAGKTEEENNKEGVVV